jgi:FkbM family methyltransferase
MGFATHVRRHCPRLWFHFKFLRYKYLRGEREIRLLARLVPKDRIAIDIGSSIGLYSRELARHVPKVVAFEANAAVADFARLVAAPNVEIVNVALSANDARAELRIPINAKGDAINDLATVEARNNSHPGEALTIEIATKRLDDYDFPDCGFIKIDVEGHEEAVLDGAMRLIKKQRPILMIELVDAHNSGTIKRVVDRCSRLSYAAYFLSREGRLRPFAEFDEALHQNMKLAEGLSSRRRRKLEYINNFIFVPNEDVSRLIRGA